MQAILPRQQFQSAHYAISSTNKMHYKSDNFTILPAINDH